MKSIRGRVIILVGWLVGLCSAEQLLEPMDFSELTYIFVLGMIILALIAPSLTRVPLWVLLMGSITAFFGVKIWVEPLIGGPAILLAISEACGIIVATFLAYRVGMAIHEFESAVARITIGHRDQLTENTSLGVGSLYREVRRARNHQRPLAILAIAIEEESIKSSLDRMAKEAQSALLKQYALSSVSNKLCENLEDCDLIVQSNNHFLVALPETTSDDLPLLIERLRQQVSGQVGVELRIGKASFPKDSFTLEGLIEKASREMDSSLESQVAFDVERLSVSQRIT